MQTLCLEGEDLIRCLEYYVENVIEMNIPCFAAGVVNVRIKVQDKHELFGFGPFLAILALLLSLETVQLLVAMQTYLP